MFPFYQCVLWLLLLLLYRTCKSHSSKVNAFLTVVFFEHFLLYFIRATVCKPVRHYWNNTANMILWAADIPRQSKKRMTLYRPKTIVLRNELYCYGLLFGPLLDLFQSCSFFATVNYLIFAYIRYFSDTLLYAICAFLCAAHTSACSYLYCLLECT